MSLLSARAEWPGERPAGKHVRWLRTPVDGVRLEVGSRYSNPVMSTFRPSVRPETTVQARTAPLRVTRSDGLVARGTLWPSGYTFGVTTARIRLRSEISLGRIALVGEFGDHVAEQAACSAPWRPAGLCARGLK